MKRTTAFVFLLTALASAGIQAALPPATAQAAQAGIKTCLPAIEKVETWLARGQTGNAMSFWDHNAPDANLFTAVLALESNTGNSIVNVNVAPTSDGQCVVEYSQSGHAPLTCPEFFKGLGNNFQYVRDLNSRTALIQGRGVEYFLSPTGPKGCLWVRKEIVKQPVATPQPAQAPLETKPAGKKSTTKTR